MACDVYRPAAADQLEVYRIGLLLGVSAATIRNRVLTSRRKLAIARRGTE